MLRLVLWICLGPGLQMFSQRTAQLHAEPFPGLLSVRLVPNGLTEKP